MALRCASNIAPIHPSSLGNPEGVFSFNESITFPGLLLSLRASIFYGASPLISSSLERAKYGPAKRSVAKPWCHAHAFPSPCCDDLRHRGVRRIVVS